MLLAGDLGGTKVILGLFSASEGSAENRLQVLEQRTYRSRQYPALENIIEAFLTETGAVVTSASIGVAGPVEDNRAEVTNLKWVIDGRSAAARLGFPVHLINDLEAIATAVPHLDRDDLVTLNAGDPAPHGALGIFAPGTGLGEAFLVWNGRRYEPHPSEGGHTAFGPNTPEQLALLNYWFPRMGTVSYERVCSGLGIPNIYTFLKESGQFPEPEWLALELAMADDPTPVIVTAAIEQDCEICVATLDLFMQVMGNEAGNLTLTVLATGGIYLGGGIPPRIVDQLKAGPFMDCFRNKGRLGDLLSDVPVHIITHPRPGLLGAALDALLMTEV